ncbi:hypothetical protein C8R46DRAFT_1082814 [Mycena filopes]|nr:hypothetical protein C8R46DRAFT_1082814 [Mycena filopes]
MYHSHLHRGAAASPARRRCWKKTKERLEGVWSPVLETALLDALEKYRPTTNNNNRLLLRFPRRNRFISDFIFSATGTRRTAKQVGSRLQQMRETCSDARILRLISRREFSEPELDAEATTSTPIELVSPISSASDLSDSEVEAGIPNTFVTIELVPPSRPSGSHDPRSPAMQSQIITTNQQSVLLEYPLDIANTNPLLTFSTARKISTSRHYSHFQLFLGDVFAHSEVTRLAFVETAAAPTSPGQQHTYSTNLIPLFWAHLCRTAQLFQCVIIQDIMKTPTAFDTPPTSPGPNDYSIRSVTYDFTAAGANGNQPPPPLPGPAPSFRPPALTSEPPLPPGFPAPRRTPLRTHSGVDNHAASAYTYTTSRPQQVQETVTYGWSADGSAVALPADGLFAGTAFNHQQQAAAALASSWLPQLPSSSSPSSSFNADPFYTPNEWLGPNGHYYYPTSTANPSSSMWSDAPMYSELDSKYRY